MCRWRWKKGPKQRWSGYFSLFPFPSCRGSQNGPRREGFASPRNTGAPLTAAGRSERTPPSKRERGRVKSNQTTAVLAPFSTAIDSRREKRSPQTFRVLLSNGEKPLSMQYVSTENVSPYGARVRTNRPWKKGTAVLVKSALAQVSEL